jgi:Cu/Ag efflux pump CusA
MWRADRKAPCTPFWPCGKRFNGLASDEGYEVNEYFASSPKNSLERALKWDGEWQITYEVFRDLGLAFAFALVLIYVLVVGWFKSFTIPLVVMVPIPLTLVGILPAHWALGAFFTATSMIGFIAGAGSWCAIQLFWWTLFICVCPKGCRLKRR